MSLNEFTISQTTRRVCTKIAMHKIEEWILLEKNNEYAKWEDLNWNKLLIISFLEFGSTPRKSDKNRWSKLEGQQENHCMCIGLVGHTILSEKKIWKERDSSKLPEYFRECRIQLGELLYVTLWKLYLIYPNKEN